MKNLKIGIVLSLLALAACKKESGFDGPSLNDLYGDFFVQTGFSSSRDSVDFSNGETVSFTAAFSKNVDWTIKIKGLSSGAVKIQQGFGHDIASTWDGTITELPMIHTESCAVQVTFANQADTLRDTVFVVAPRPATGLVLADFESGLNPGWSPYVQSGANMSFVVRSSAQSAQGNRYYDMGGEVTWDWLIGYLDLPASAYGSSHFALNENPNVVYFNTFLYKPEGITNGLVLFQFREDDNGDGVYSEGQEDLYSIQVSGGANGWSQISERYDNIVTLVNGAEAAPIGNGLHEPNKLWKVSVLFLANPTSGYSQTYLDNVVFTENAPLNP